MRIRPVSASEPVQDVFAEGDIERALQPAGRTPKLRPIAQSAWLTQQQPAESIETPQRELSLEEPQERVPNFFTDPFGDDPTAGEPPAQTMQDDSLFPPPAKTQPFRADDSPPTNQLRSRFDQLDQPLRERSPTPPAEFNPPRPTPRQLQPRDDGPTLGDMLRENDPNDEFKLPRAAPNQPAPNEPAPQQPEPTRGGLFDENPFPQRRQGDVDDGFGRQPRYGTEDVVQDTGLTCEELRTRIAEQTIDQVSLDISPPYRPDEIDIERYQKLKAEFDEKQIIRQWNSVDGRPLATGRLRDLAYEQAVIETENGSVKKLQLSQLSDPDLAYVSQSWGLPSECQIERVAHTPRNWSKLTMTWKASNLCHNPLYFQDVNLERYGHTHGPFLEPVVQSAHFFGGILVLPYKMGVHTPTECQYPLGYYRPGNCAPWITQPFPLSTRGALSQAATMTGLFWLIP